MKNEILFNINLIFDFILKYPQVVLAALVVLTVLLIGIFRGFKKHIRLIIFLLVFFGILIGLSYLAQFVYVQVKAKNYAALIDAGVKYLPTAMFVLIIVCATLTGVRRGARKSVILMVNALCAGAVCIAFYFICVSFDSVDATVVKVINKFMGSATALQDALNVSEDCATLKQIFAEYVPTLIGNNAEIGVLVGGSGAYIAALVSLGYHLAFALLSSVIYMVLVFILYLIYAIFYSEKKYRKKKIAAFAENKTDRTYKKHRLGGGVIGFARGLVVALVSVSMLGSVFYMVAGTGEATLEEREFGDEKLDFIYSTYRSIESYGAHGIFKVLNAVKDGDDAPYYLFAADLVFSGELDDAELGVKKNVKFAKEIGAYTGFAKDTFSLLMKYGEDEITPLLKGEATDGAMNTVLGVMKDPAFRSEFENLIDNFTSQKYFVNLAFNLANSVIANIDDLSFADALGENKELIKLLFKKGYYSDVIPDEREMNAPATADDVHPYFNISHVLNKDDVKIAYNVVMTLLTGKEEGADTLGTIKKIVPQLSKLSILNGSRKAEFDPVLGRLYCYVENKYLTPEGCDGLTYAEIASESVSWTDEINSLLGVADDVLYLYDSVKNAEGDASAAEKIIDNVFDGGDNEARFNAVCGEITNSRLLGKALASGYVTALVEEQIKAVAADAFIPKNLVYENVTNENGVVYGELHNLLYGLRSVARNKDIIGLLFGGEAPETTELIKRLAAAVNVADEDGGTLTGYVAGSGILRSLVSSVLVSQTGDVLYVPDTALEKDGGVSVNCFTEKEMASLLSNLSDISVLLDKFSDGFEADKISELLDDEAVNRLIFSSESGVIEGTVSKMLIDALDGGDVKIPAGYKNSIELWTTEGTGELKNLFNAIKAVDVTALFGETPDLGKLIDEMSDNVDVMLNSAVVHFTVSEYLRGGEMEFGGFTIKIPSSVTVSRYGETVIDGGELNAVFTQLKDFDFGENADINAVFVKLVEKKETLKNSKIITASMVSYMVGEASINSILPSNYIAAADDLDNAANLALWNGELPSFLGALDVLLGITAGNDFDLNSVESVITDMSVKEISAKLGDIYVSDIIATAVTKEIDNAVDGNISPAVLKAIKGRGNYALNDVAALLDALDALGIGKITEVSSDNFGNLKTVRDNIGRVYASRIAAGCITKTVSEIIADDETLKDAPQAYDGDKIYKKCEIEAILSFLPESGDLNDFKLGSLSAVRDLLYDEGVTKSYILAATVTAELILNDKLVIPSTLVVGDIIAPMELSRLLDAYIVYSGSDEAELENFTVQIDLNLDWNRILDSEIMCATVTFNLADKVSEDLYVSVSAASVVTDYGSGVVYTAINKAQLVALFDALRAIGQEGGDFTVPEFNSVSDLNRYDDEQLKMLFATDLVRYRIADMLIDNGIEMFVEAYNASVYDVHRCTQTEKKSITEQLLNDNLEIIRNMR